MIRFPIGFAAMLVGLSFPSFGQDTDWRVTTLGEIAVSFVDLKSFNRAGNQITFRYQIQFRDKKNIARLSAHVSADCTNRSYRDLQATGYTADGTSADVADHSSRFASPGSNMAGLIDRVCSGAWLSKAAVDPTLFAGDFFRAAGHRF